MFQSMEVRGKIPTSALRCVIEGIFFCTLFALPWINLFRASTLLLLLTGGILIFTGLLHINYTGYKRQILFAVFSTYFLLQVLAFCRYHDVNSEAGIEQKASLIAIPLFLYVLIGNYEGIWRTGILGFIAGNTVAALWCMVAAVVQYAYHHDSSLFFYHRYASTISLNAIYFSLYLLIALGYIVLNKFSFSSFPAIFLGVFLYINLLLLSSKVAIIVGSLLLFLLLFRLVKGNAYKIVLLAVASGIFILLNVTANPIKKRFADVDIAHYASAFTVNNFSEYHFDGLNIRLVLWRLGYELINDKKEWLYGDGGKHYYQGVNSKIEAYQLYTGNKRRGDTGYLGYNMHNQYMESYVQFGLIGLSLLVFALGYVLYKATRYRQLMLFYATVLFMVFFLTESVLETQSGILLFTIILSGEWIQLQKKRSGSAIL